MRYAIDALSGKGTRHAFQLNCSSIQMALCSCSIGLVLIDIFFSLPANGTESEFEDTDAFTPLQMVTARSHTGIAYTIRIGFFGAHVQNCMAWVSYDTFYGKKIVLF